MRVYKIEFKRRAYPSLLLCYKYFEKWKLTSQLFGYCKEGNWLEIEVTDIKIIFYLDCFGKETLKMAELQIHHTEGTSKDYDVHFYKTEEDLVCDETGSERIDRKIVGCKSRTTWKQMFINLDTLHNKLFNDRYALKEFDGYKCIVNSTCKQAEGIVAFEIKNIFGDRLIILTKEKDLLKTKSMFSIKRSR